MKRSIPFILLFIAFFSLKSCYFSDHKAHFEVINKSDFEIDSLKIEPMTTSNGKFIQLATNETIKYDANMKGIPKTDGEYIISYHLDGKKFRINHGYYTNGSPTHDLVIVEILNDTIHYKYQSKYQ